MLEGDARSPRELHTTFTDRGNYGPVNGDSAACVRKRLVERRAARDQRSVAHHVTRLAEPERSADAAVALEHRDELAALEVTVRHLELIACVEPTDALDLAVVLVAPHER